MTATLFHSVACPSSDADLLERFVSAREEAAFTELVRRHGPVVYRVCRRIVGPAAADDAFQATFLVLATRANQVRRSSRVGSWLFGVAGRVAKQMRKREMRNQPPHPQPLSRQGRGEPETAGLAAVLDDELARLPDRLRGPLVACLVQHRTHKQAAAELGESERTLRRRLDEAKRLLRLRLERRGVVPVVAAGLVSGVGQASANVPRELTDRAVNLVFDFLAGGVALASAPAVIAKGVTMSGMLWKATAAMVCVAVGLTAVGVGLADDKPKAEERKLPPPELPAGGGPGRYAASKPIAATDVRTDPPGSVVRSKNFLVQAPDAVIARAVANEAEFLRGVLAKMWLGKELPAWKQQAVIEVKIDFKQPTGATTFTYAQEIGVDSIKTQLSGSFEQVLRTQLPHEVTHCVLASHFGKPLPRWADEGIALQSEPAAEQARHDVLCREVLNAGRGIPLKRLLPMMEYPQDLPVLYAQGHSLVRFLLMRKGKAQLSDDSGKPLTAPEIRLITFLAHGLTSDNGSWDRAAEQLYGFDDLDAMQEAWIDWLRRPESVLQVKTKPGEGAAPWRMKDDPDHIPPTRLGK